MSKGITKKWHVKLTYTKQTDGYKNRMNMVLQPIYPIPFLYKRDLGCNNTLSRSHDN